MTDRAVILSRIADAYMAYGAMPWPLPGGCRSLTFKYYPPQAAEPTEIRFAAEWPGITIVCSRPLPRDPGRGMSHD